MKRVAIITAASSAGAVLGIGCALLSLALAKDSTAAF